VTYLCLFFLLISDYFAKEKEGLNYFKFLKISLMNSYLHFEFNYIGFPITASDYIKKGFFILLRSSN
jgi:hypothetical protein